VRAEVTLKAFPHSSQVIDENFIEMILDMVNQNVQETLKKFQDNKNREFEKAQ
jgi:hypothetical protein